MRSFTAKGLMNVKMFYQLIIIIQTPKGKLSYICILRSKVIESKYDTNLIGLSR